MENFKHSVIIIGAIIFLVNIKYKIFSSVFFIFYIYKILFQAFKLVYCNDNRLQNCANKAIYYEFMTSLEEFGDKFDQLEEAEYKRILVYKCKYYSPNRFLGMAVSGKGVEDYCFYVAADPDNRHLFNKYMTSYANSANNRIKYGYVIFGPEDKDHQSGNYDIIYLLEKGRFCRENKVVNMFLNKHQIHNLIKLFIGE